MIPKSVIPIHLGLFYWNQISFNTYVCMNWFAIQCPHLLLLYFLFTSDALIVTKSSMILFIYVCIKIYGNDITPLAEVQTTVLSTMLNTKVLIVVTIRRKNTFMWCNNVFSCK